MSRLATVRREIEAHPDNSWATELGYAPIYVAHPDARCLIVGQAPGIRAQTSGIPWNDASGVRLIEWLGISEAMFRSPENFAILPMDFYYPGKGTTGDLPPRPGFAETWHPRLLAEMPQIRLSLLVGDYAQRRYLQDRRSLTERVRFFGDYLPTQFPLPHPSPLNFRWQARNPWFASQVVPELRRQVSAALNS